MILERPDLRRALRAGLEALGDLDAMEGGRSRHLAFDNLTFELEWLDHGGGAARQIGTILLDAGEARALDGLQAALDLLYGTLGGSASHERALAHPGLLAVLCCAAHAADLLARGDAPDRAN